VLFSISLASEVLIVATPEPTSLTDAYAAIKVLAMQQKRQHVRMVINQTARPGDGRAITGQLQQVLERFVTTTTGRALRLIHMGDIPADPAVRDAVMRRQLLLLQLPGCPARWPLRNWQARSRKRCWAGLPEDWLRPSNQTPAPARLPAPPPAATAPRLPAWPHRPSAGLAHGHAPHRAPSAHRFCVWHRAQLRRFARRQVAAHSAASAWMRSAPASSCPEASSRSACPGCQPKGIWS